eukprot:TRINITY_DN1880_c0_g3_i2.p1 TRINITY_DN1880_c0_g3~~TRINITY_DN1880_c0_g3_i2.p1  ORF type:complete len:258 (+),score=43.00 TRINITY_DN1880_c0_g3_i2:544-1317(+)
MLLLANHSHIKDLSIHAWPNLHLGHATALTRLSLQNRSDVCHLLSTLSHPEKIIKLDIKPSKPVDLSRFVNLEELGCNDQIAIWPQTTKPYKFKSIRRITSDLPSNITQLAILSEWDVHLSHCTHITELTLEDEISVAYWPPNCTKLIVKYHIPVQLSCEPHQIRYLDVMDDLYVEDYRSIPKGINVRYRGRYWPFGLDPSTLKASVMIENPKLRELVDAMVNLQKQSGDVLEAPKTKHRSQNWKPKKRMPCEEEEE